MINKKFKQYVDKRFALGITISLLILSTLSFYSSLEAHSRNAHVSRQQSSHAEDALELGIALETEFWTAVQNQNVNKFSNMIDPVFQGLNISGPYTREQGIAGLTGVALVSFVINNPVATRSKEMLVLSYDFVPIGSSLVGGPSVTVWKKKGHAWKIVSSSYVPFIPNLD